MTIEPLGDRLVIKKIVPETKTHKGLLLPSTSNSPTDQATVVAVGPGPMTPTGEFLKMPIQVGDVIYLRTHCGMPIMDEGEECHIIKLDDVLARSAKK